MIMSEINIKNPKCVKWKMKTKPWYIPRFLWGKNDIRIEASFSSREVNWESNFTPSFSHEFICSVCDDAKKEEADVIDTCK